MLRFHGHSLHRKGGLNISVLGGGADPPDPPDPVPFEDWANYFEITSDNTSVFAAVGVLFYNFQDAPAEFWAGVKVAGADVRITNSDGSTEVAREVVGFDKVSEFGGVFFKADGLQTDADTVYRIYYNNADALEPEGDAANGKESVWPSEYIGAWHLANDDYTDSTENGLNALGVNAPGKGAGKFGFDVLDITFAENDHVKADLGSLLSTYFMEGWLRQENRQGESFFSYVDSAFAGTNRRESMGLYNEVEIRIWDSVNGYFEPETPILPDLNVWFHAGMSYSASERRFVYNGEEKVVDAIASRPTSLETMFFGADDKDFNEVWDGKLMFFRIRNVYPSANELQTEFNNMNDPSAFWTTGSEVDNT